MTMNYPIAEIETKAVPPRYKTRPEEERKKEAEERKVELYHVDCSVVDTDPIKTSITWVSHGNYSLNQPKANYKYDPENISLPYTYMEIEADQFDQIIKAYEENEPITKSEGSYDCIFKPFWQGDVPLRGMMPIPVRLNAYFCGKKENGFVIQKQTYNIFFGFPSDSIEQLGFTIEDFKKVRDAALSAKDEDKPIHYCQMDWSSKGTS